jgi:superfamily II DNA or RNA helicase
MFDRPALATLRPYQVNAIAALRAHANAGRTRLLLTVPTGGGKTLTAADIMRSALSYGHRVLFVVHLRELVDQTVRALARCGITHVGVMRGDDDRVDESAPVQVASIQTLARRKRPDAQVVILDEAHRSLADTYAAHIWDAYPDAVVIGLTATPCRGDGRPLGDRYQELVVGATYSELIAGGFVAEPIVYAPRIELDTSSLRRVAGDWDAEQVEEMMSGLAGEIVPTWQAHAGGRSTIVFASGIRHSRDIVRRFLEAGVTAEHLDGETPGDERAAILERLASGETTVVSNCAVLTEGFDSPGVRCAVIARPTLSLVLHMQTAGRALRPGPVQPVIIDHAGNVGRHGMPHEDRVWSIHGPAKRVAAKSLYRTCAQCFAYYAVSASACPHCGFAPPVKERELPVEAPAVVERVTTDLIERNFYVSAVNLARSRGLKPGMAGFKFKEKFGRWPPWSWSQETKAQFASDSEWQRKLEHRQAEKAHFAAQEAEALARQAAEPVVEDAGYTTDPVDWIPDDDIPFIFDATIFGRWDRP